MILTLVRVTITRRPTCLLRALKNDNYSYRRFSAILRAPNLISLPVSSCFTLGPASSTGTASSNDYLRLNQQRNKSKSSKGSRNTTTIEEEDDNDNVQESDDQFMKVSNLSLSSMRLDLVLKTAFGISRSKIESSFYQNRIFVNGKLAPKKNYEVEAKDEIDIVRGRNEQNNSFIDVMRLEILSVQVPKGGNNIIVKVHRFKQLTIENYASNPWSGSNED